MLENRAGVANQYGLSCYLVFINAKLIGRSSDTGNCPYNWELNGINHVVCCLLDLDNHHLDHSKMEGGDHIADLGNG